MPFEPYAAAVGFGRRPSRFFGRDGRPTRQVSEIGCRRSRLDGDGGAAQARQRNGPVRVDDHRANAACSGRMVSAETVRLGWGAIRVAAATMIGDGAMIGSDVTEIVGDDHVVTMDAVLST